MEQRSGILPAIPVRDPEQVRNRSFPLPVRHIRGIPADVLESVEPFHGAARFESEDKIAKDHGPFQPEARPPASVGRSEKDGVRLRLAGRPFKQLVVRGSEFAQAERDPSYRELITKSPAE